MKRLVTVLMALTMVVFLSACDTAEERAEKHFQTAMTLLQEGDEERAIVEFRNVFKLNGLHKEARTEYAELQRRRGNLSEAIGQYLRLVEQYPDDLNGNRSLAEMFARIGRWEEMERYITAASALDPQDDSIRALKAVSDYRVAVDDEDELAATAAAQAAVEIQKDQPENIMLWQVIIDNEIRSLRYGSALDGLDQAIAIDPQNKDLYQVRLSVLGALEDTAGIEQQLKDMIEIFPEDESSRMSLVRWYVSQGQLDDAESYLRGAIDPDDEDPESRMVLLRFLTELRGQEAGLAEVNRMIESGQTAPIFQSLKAGLEFELGDEDQAIADMQSLVETLGENDEARRIKVGLAQMLEETGNSVGARALVEEVLEVDSSQVDALKMKADWLIDGDLPGEAIVALRTALDQSPRDPEIMTLLARAHERDGNLNLVGEMLSLAVEASNRAPEESVRYAQYLIGQGKLDPAESVLIDALRLAPLSYDILFELGIVYVNLRDWERADQVIDALREIETEDGEAYANELQARVLIGQQNQTAVISFLEGLVTEGSAGFEANMTIISTYLENGESDEARRYVDGLLAESPNDTGVQFMDATVDAATGEVASAEEKYRAILARDDTQINIWIALFRLKNIDGNETNARALLDEAQQAMPDDPTLKWIRAGYLENDGDIDGAIAIYEDLYAEDSDNMVVANNLASLITARSEDAETIERAYAIARRLRMTTIPPYQDTYGWIAFLRGDIDEAVRSLQPAAAALVDDPAVQYHLGRAYVAADRPDEARIQFQKVLDLVGPDDTRDFVQTSRSELERLNSAQ